eukprot:15338703-Ditylum_brightwellii.AAC.3
MKTLCVGVGWGVKLAFSLHQDRKPSGLGKSMLGLSLGRNHEGQSIHFIMDTSDMCMGLVGSAQTKFCTKFMCSTRSHKSKFAASAGV